MNSEKIQTCESCGSVHVAPSIDREAPSQPVRCASGQTEPVYPSAPGRLCYYCAKCADGAFTRAYSAADREIERGETLGLPADEFIHFPRRRRGENERSQK